MNIKSYTFLRRFIPVFLLGLLASGLASAQYCTTGLYSSGCVAFGDYIQSFSTTGGSTNITNNGSGCSIVGNSYYDYTTTMVHTAEQGQTVNFSVTISPALPSTDPDGFKVWVDWNGDEDFDDLDELVYTSTLLSGGATASGSFAVPGSATVGVARMRVRCVYNKTSAISPCGQETWGEIEDYGFEVLASSFCLGTPNPGSTLAPGSACIDVPFSLSVQNFIPGSGVSYEWQSAPDAGGAPGAWTTVGTNSSSISISQATGTWYQSIVTCNGSPGNSTPVFVPMSPIADCYCVPGPGVPFHAATISNEISNVSIVGTTLNASSSVAGTDGYTNVPPTPASNTGTISTGVNQTINVTGTGFYVGVWLDVNQNGSFESAEFLTLTAVAGGFTGTVNLPVGLPSGPTRMRIRSTSTAPILGTYACSNLQTGETEDYTVEIVNPSACGGTPVPGTATANATSLCAAQSATLTLAGYTIATGVDIAWESSPAGAGAWTPTGMTGNIQTVVGSSLTGPTDYRAVVTCGNGGGSDVSNTITLDIASPFACYCGPLSDGTVLHSSVNNYMTNAAISGTTLNSSNGTNLSNGYTQVPQAPASNTADLAQGITYTFTGTLDPLLGAPGQAGIYIDYDQSGTLDVSEYIPLTVNGSASVTATFTIPATATVGMTGFRVRLRGGSFTTSCETFGSGETEDYVVTIVAGSACSGTPAAGVASGPSGACVGQAFDLTLAGYTTGVTGIDIQWESSPSGAGTWSPISGATADVFSVAGQVAATDYRAAVRCSAGTPEYSNTVSVVMNIPTQCYCTPTYTNACSSNDDIHSFTLAGENSTSFNDLNTGCSAGNYDDKTGLPAVELALGGTYNGEINSQYTGNEDVKMWIDFGDDGIFDASDEMTTLDDVAQTMVPFSITIPGAASLGTHRMRIRMAWNTGGSAVDPCINYGYGETHDYMVTIIVPPSCLAPSGVAAISASSTTANISWNSVAGASGYEYIVDQSSGVPSGAGTSIAGTTEVVGSLSAATTYYLHVRSECGSGNFSGWSTLGFQTLLGNDNANGAMALTVGAGCTGSPYFNTGASQSPGEPFASCEGTEGYKTVWYSFVAPASGAVKVSNDYAGTAGDSRLAVFSAGDVNDYTTFSILGCDDDNGVVSGAKSMVYLTTLTPGATYYVQVDGYGSGTATGTFCLTVDELSSSMLSATGSCTNGQNNYGINTTYTGWLSLTDGSGLLIANVRQTAGSATGYDGTLTVNTGAVRNYDGQTYLDRNFLINATGVTSADVQFFFTDADLLALGAPLSSLNVTHQPGATCASNFDIANGAVSTLLQGSNGSSAGANWLTVTTPGFSNFYIMAGITPLAIELKDISAVNVGQRNRVDFITAKEEKGDYFIVEHSTDGSNFTAIGRVDAKGQPSSYSFWDESPVTGINYYQLKLVDVSGKFTYTRKVTATVRSNGTFAVKAYPNPVSDLLTVKIYGQMGANALISVADVTGKVISVLHVAGNEAKVDMNGLRSGVYLIKYSDDNHSQMIKVNKQ